MKVIRESFGDMPLAGYVAEIIHDVSQYDGLYVLEFLSQIREKVRIVDCGMPFFYSYEIDNFDDYIVTDCYEELIHFLYMNGRNKSMAVSKLYCEDEDYGVQDFEFSYNGIKELATLHILMEDGCTVRSAVKYLEMGAIVFDAAAEVVESFGEYITEDFCEMYETDADGLTALIDAGKVKEYKPVECFGTKHYIEYVL